jgi:hypothetical protein
MTRVRVPAWSCAYRLTSAALLPAPGTFRLSHITTGRPESSNERPFRRTPQSSVHFGCLQTRL